MATSIKAKAIADAKAILNDREKLAVVERWFFNKEVCGTVADLFVDHPEWWMHPGPFDRPYTIAEAIERLQFPFDPRPELSGYQPPDGPAVPGRRDAGRYFNHFMETLVNGLQEMRAELSTNGGGEIPEAI